MSRSEQHVCSGEEKKKNKLPSGQNNVVRIHTGCCSSNPQDDEGSIRNGAEGTLDNVDLLEANKPPKIQLTDIIEAWGEDGQLELFPPPGFSSKDKEPASNRRSGNLYVTWSYDDDDEHDDDEHEYANRNGVKRRDDVREVYMEKKMDLPYLPESFEREREWHERRRGGYDDQLNNNRRNFPAIDGFSDQNQLLLPAAVVDDGHATSERERLVVPPKEGMHFDQTTLSLPLPQPVDLSSNELPQPSSLSSSQPKQVSMPFEPHPQPVLPPDTLQREPVEVLEPIPPPILIPAAPLPQPTSQGQKIFNVMSPKYDSSSSEDLSSLEKIFNVMSPKCDSSSSEDLSSLGGSDKAAYHGPQHSRKHRIIDLDWAYEKHWTKEMKSNNKKNGGPSPGMMSNRFPADHQTRDQRCVTPQKHRIANSPPITPKSPVSPTSQTSQTYHHTFRTNRHMTRSPAPAFVVVPTSGNARVTVTTLGCVHSDDDDEEENLVYWRQIFILAVGAVMFLGIITMVSGLVSGTFEDVTTLPPTPISLNRPPIGASPAQSPTIFESTEPVPTLPPALSFPVEVTRAPGIFPPIGAKAVREETPSPTISSEPTIWRTERPEFIVSKSGSVDEASKTSYPTFPPTQDGPSSE